ncbi:MAG: hypothetical protein ACIPMY_06390, partial [Rickettsia endosymbiont of Pentastiridius leporinus]
NPAVFLQTLIEQPRVAHEHLKIKFGVIELRSVDSERPGHYAFTKDCDGNELSIPNENYQEHLFLYRKLNPNSYTYEDSQKIWKQHIQEEVVQLNNNFQSKWDKFSKYVNKEAFENTLTYCLTPSEENKQAVLNSCEVGTFLEACFSDTSAQSPIFNDVTIPIITQALNNNEIPTIGNS